MNIHPQKVLKADLKKFYRTLNKLTDGRFNFSLNRTFENGVFYLELNTHFCSKLIHVCRVNEVTEMDALECLIDLCNYATLKHDQDYFDKFGVSFEIYLNKLNGKPYYLYRKTESDKWVKISQVLAENILESKDISINGLCDNVVSYCLYDCYYKINLKMD